MLFGGIFVNSLMTTFHMKLEENCYMRLSTKSAIDGINKINVEKSK